MAALFKLWKISAQNRPYTTIVATEIALSSCGDILAQSLDHFEFFKVYNDSAHQLVKEPTAVNGWLGWYDPMRTMRFTLVATMISPIGFRWHKFLDKRVPLNSKIVNMESKSRISRFRIRLKNSKPVAKRVVYDQVLYEPLAYITIFTSLGILEQLNFQEIKEKVRSTAIPTYITGLALWPFIQAVNFSLIPLVYRVPFMSIFDIFWDTYMSWMNSHSLKREDVVAQ